MQSAAAKLSTSAIVTMTKADAAYPAFRTGGLDTLFTNGSTVIRIDDRTISLADGAPIAMPRRLVAGLDFEIVLNPDNSLSAHAYGAAGEFGHPVIGGFHYAPGGNAQGRSGGDAIPAINPFSIYDVNFRPACANPRGMTLVDGKFWADIYLLGTGHADGGTSLCGADIADGDSLKKLDYAAAVSILAEHGKQVMSIVEFIEAAYGVVEKAARSEEPQTTGIVEPDDAKFISKWGLVQATGNMWVWGHDGDPDAPRASVFGGSWISGSFAGSRYADLGYRWPGHSGGDLGARGRSDHLIHG